MSRETMIWIDALLAGSISPEDFARLQTLLKSDPAALRHYREQADIHG